jgi:hypothetical protein
VSLVGPGSCLFDEKINLVKRFSSSNFAMATVLHRTPEPFASLGKIHEAVASSGLGIWVRSLALLSRKDQFLHNRRTMLAKS